MATYLKLNASNKVEMGERIGTLIAKAQKECGSRFLVSEELKEIAQKIAGAMLCHPATAHAAVKKAYFALLNAS